MSSIFRTLLAYPVSIVLRITGKRISKFHRHNNTVLYRCVDVVKANMLAEGF